ncbi:thioredoxin family protein [Sporosarcina sp. FA9]|uniref:thioredoxin family protein n=1 Tax=Sporosarcina sp. FA9 TaxID=3413030 RepID=UPI003F66010E
MGLNEWYEKGLTATEYTETLDTLKEGFSFVAENFKPSPDKDFFEQIKAMNLRVLILTEPWCGHCMFNIPIALKMAKHSNMPVRLLLRDENLELMDQYLTNGKSRTIPIILFIDEDGNEVAKWGPITKKTRQFVDKYRKELPLKDADDYDEKLQEMYTITRKAFSTDTGIWKASYDGMKQALLDGTN